jgi:hypothetical protein
LSHHPGAARAGHINTAALLLSPQQLFGWRRELQASQAALSRAEELQFVPAVLDVAPSSSVRHRRKIVRLNPVRE